MSPSSAGRRPRGAARAMSWRRTTGASLAILAAGMGLASCSDDDPDVDDPPEAVSERRPITAEEASTLADVLPMNLEAGGAAFHATAPFGVATFELDGEIDWVNHVGSATVTPNVDGADDSTPFAVSFSRSVVFEEVPGLADALAAAGQTRANWVARALDAESSPLDVILTLIDASASTQRDNPVLLQSNGAEWVGQESVDGETADVFDLGRTSYWVGVDSGRLLRSEADLEMTNSVVVIEWSDPGPRTVEVPAAADIVDLAEVSELYTELRATDG